MRGGATSNNDLQLPVTSLAGASAAPADYAERYTDLR